MEYGLGIDFGTTYSAAAVSRNGRVEICTLGTRAPSIPTVVFVREDGQMLVGEPAERRSATQPDRSAAAFKRRLGDPTPLILGGTPYGAEALTAKVLAAIVAQVTQAQGGAPSSIVLTHPAGFGAYKLDMLRIAADQADIGPVTFISEPQAAAVHYASLERIEPGQVVAVYDFGGGTFDAAVLRRTATGFDLIGHPEGLERIGGIDLDHAVLQHVAGAIGSSITTLQEQPGAEASFGRLRDEARSAKEALSSDADVSVPIALPNLNTQVRLTRVEFEAMIRPRVADTIEALRRAVRSAGLEMSAVDRILLVGGTSRIPLVREMVQEQTGRPVSLDVHPKHSVAMGAADIASSRASAPPVSPAPSPSLPKSAGPPPPPSASTPATPPSATTPPLAAVVPPPPASRPAATGSPAPPPAAAAPRSAAAPPPRSATPPTSPPPPSDASPDHSAPAAAAPPSARRRGPLVAAGVVVLVLVLGVIGLVVFGGDDESADGTPAATNDAGETADPVGDAGSEPFAPTLPRARDYASLTINVERFVIRTQDPGAFEAGRAAEPDGPAYAFVDLTVYNSLTIVPVAVSATGFVLRLSDGTEIVGSQQGDPVVQPSSQIALLVTFPLDGVTDVAGSILAIVDENDEPVDLPLDGDDVAPDGPTEVPIERPLTIVGADGLSSSWYLATGLLSPDVQIDDDDFAGGMSTAERRSFVGYRWLTLPINLSADVCECDGVQVDDSMIRLVVDGNEIAPINVFSEFVTPGNDVGEVLAFEVPGGSSDIAVRIGPADQTDQQQSLPISLP